MRDCIAVLLACCSLAVDASAEERTATGLVADWRFTGTDVFELSAVGSKVGSDSDGQITFVEPGRLESRDAGRAIVSACRKSNALSVEVWLKPANTKQKGPARIITLSGDTSRRNFTLGQDGDRFDVRLRTTKTSTNGLPSTATKKNSVDMRLTHVVFTRAKNGSTTLYVDGNVAGSGQAKGDFSNWDDGFALVVGDEASGGRPWLGDLSLVAVYSKALSAAEVAVHFEAGPTGARSPEVIAAEALAKKSHFFETKIAPLLADQCLECHDSATREGSLDLSSKLAVFEGGDSGSALVAHKLSDSLLWTSVESDDMPHDREPLTGYEKSLLKQWIEEGAVWSLDRIDPAVYEFNDMSDPFVQRLTVDEYIATVKAATGVDIGDEARELLPRDLRADGFSNTAYNLTVDLKHVQSFARLAETIVGRMDVATFCRRFSKKQAVNDKDNRALIADVGRWLLRGPLDDHEIVSYRGIVTTVVSAGGSFEEAMTYVVEAMLQSPRFVYRIESGEARPSQFELANRLSYILIGAPPDKALFADAEQGRLDRGTVRTHAARLLSDPRAKQRSLDFASQWLNLGRLSSMRPSEVMYPDWDAQLAADMRTETLAYFEEVVWEQRRPIGDLMNAQVAYVTPRLASHYGINATLEVEETARPVRVQTDGLPERGGLLTQGSVLTVGGDEASMVTRGLFVMHDLLRGVVKDPPPCVNTTPVPTAKGVTQRTIAEARLKNEACGGCHAKFEPLAFGLEKFDGLGSYHNEDEHGNTLREDGQILIPGEAAPRSYRTSAELMDLLAASPRVAETLTWKITQFAMGRPLGASDAPAVSQIHQAATSAGGTYQATIEAIVLSDLVQK